MIFVNPSLSRHGLLDLKLEIASASSTKDDAESLFEQKAAAEYNTKDSSCNMVSCNVYCDRLIEQGMGYLLFLLVMFR